MNTISAEGRHFLLQLKMVPVKSLTRPLRQEFQTQLLPLVIKVVLQMFLAHQGQDLRSHYYMHII